jgi:hypothetical protein
VAVDSLDMGAECARVATVNRPRLVLCLLLKGYDLIDERHCQEALTLLTNLDGPPSVFGSLKQTRASLSEHTVGRFDQTCSEQVKHFLFHRLISVSESDKFSDLDEKGSAREETTGISGLSIPDLIDNNEEIFSERDPLGEFERDHVLPHLKYQSPEPVRTPSPRQKRGGSTDEAASIEQSVRGRETTTLPTIKRFNSAGFRRYRPPAGRGAFQSPLRTRAGVRSLEREEEFLRSAFLFLQEDVYPAMDKVGRALNKFREKFRKRCAPFRI